MIEDPAARAAALRGVASVVVAHRNETPLSRADSDDDGEEDPNALMSQLAMNERKKEGWKVPKAERGTEVPARPPVSASWAVEEGNEEPSADAAKAASNARVRDAWRKPRASGGR